MIHFQRIFTKDNSRNIVFLFGIIILQIAAYFYVRPRIIQNDDIAYINSALSILDGSYKFTPSVFTQRFLVFLPISLLYSLFGVNIYTSTAHLLIFAVCQTIIIYLIGNKIRNGMGILAAFLFAFNPLTLFSTVELIPDLICSTFLLAAIYFLYISESNIKMDKNILYGFLFSLFLFMSVLAKEYIVFYLPFLIFLGIRKYKLHYKFWNSSIISFVVLIAILGLFYKIQTGSYIYKLTAIESEHNSSIWSFFFSSGETIHNRLFFGLYRLLFSDSSFFVLTVFTVPLLIFIKNSLKSAQLNFWIYNFVILFIVFQYGSTSLAYYNPLPITPRMYFCLLPSLTLLAAFSMLEILNSRNNKWIYIIMVVAIISPVVCFQNFLLSKTYTFFSLLVFSVLLFIKFIKDTNLKLILLLFPVIFIFIYSVNNYPSSTDFTKNIYDNYIGRLEDKSIVVMNERSIFANKYYNFYNSNHLLFINWEDIKKDPLPAFKKDKLIYLLIDYNEEQSLHKHYNTYIPKFVNNTNSKWKVVKEYCPYAIFRKENVTLGLYKITSLEELKEGY